MLAFFEDFLLSDQDKTLLYDRFFAVFFWSNQNFSILLIHIGMA
jgi:hypothetical protein